MKQELIISVHIPKTAGTTFGAILQKKYRRSFLFVYVAPSSTDRYCVGATSEILIKNLRNENETSLTKEEVFEIIAREKITCVHGHFKLDLFLHQEFPGMEKRFITWVREPHARNYSEYLHLKRDGRISSTTSREGVLHFLKDMGYRMIEMLGTDLSVFSFIGRTEYFDEDIRRFGISTPYVFLNKTESTTEEVDIKEAIKRLMGADILLYQAVCGSIQNSAYAQQNHALQQYRLYIESSKFWKMRALYLRSQWAIRNPLKFLRKYIWRGFPVYSQIRWAVSHPRKFLTKYFFKKRWELEKKASQQKQNTFLQKAFEEICSGLVSFLGDKYPPISVNAKNKSILVETRVLPHTEFVIKNTIQKLGNGWGHMIFCSSENKEQIQSICDRISQNIEIIVLKDKIKTRNDYNELLLSKKFWESIQCEKVLIYQTDTIILKPFDPIFLTYDYIGGFWGDEHVKLVEDVFGKKNILLGNGGLSLRKVSFVKKVLDKNNYKKVKTLRRGMRVDEGLRYIPEDLFFSIHAYDEGISIPSLRVAEEFASEFIFNRTSFGLHQPWKFFASAFELEKYIKKNLFFKTKKRILFINHQESLTGAPVLLKQIIDAEVEKNEYDCWVLTLMSLDNPWNFQQRLLFDEIPGLSSQEKARYIGEILNPDLVYANTILSLDIARHFGCKKVISIHEHRALYPYALSGELKDLNKFDRVFVACEGAQQILQQTGVSSDLIPYYLDYRHLLDASYLQKTDESYVLNVGTADFRKGFHRFCEIAREMPYKKFIWIGAVHSIHHFGEEIIRLDGLNTQTREYRYGDPLEEITLRLSIPENVELKGLLSPEETQNWIRHCDVLLLTSSDDPFPLVVIEAKIFNRNVITLKESGDSFKLCDEQDLVLDYYDKDRIVDYIRKIKPRTMEVKRALVNIFNNNYSFNRKIYRALLVQKVKVFTAIHSRSHKNSFELMEKTLRSINAYKNYEAKILVDVITPEIQKFEKYGEVIVIKSPVEAVIERNFPNYKPVLASYFRLEIPRICKERNYNDQYVLYVDYDVLFLNDPARLLPRYYVEYLAMAPEFFKNKQHDYNSGVIWMNVKNFGKRQGELFDLIEREGHTFYAHDQEAIRRVFKGQADALDVRLNWKPYWGTVSDATILHFHWLKPHTDLLSNVVQEPLQKNFGPYDIDMESCKKYIALWKKY